MPLPLGDATTEENLSLRFSHAESMLYMLYKLGEQYAEYFDFEGDPQKSKEFRSRLDHLKRSAQQ